MDTADGAYNGLGVGSVEGVSVFDDSGGSGIVGNLPWK